MTEPDAIARLRQAIEMKYGVWIPPTSDDARAILAHIDARDTEVETLRLALVACGKLLAEQALVEALNDATAALGSRA